MTEEERRILLLLRAAYVAYSTLPGVSADALALFSGAIHTCQVEVLARATLRDYPDLFAEEHGDIEPRP